MQILGTRFDDIDFALLEQLRADEVPESVTHDYKSKLPDTRDDAGKARLARVASSFANTRGGVLVIGFDETVAPWTIPGLPNFDADRDVARVEQILRSGIEPPIPGVRYRPLYRPDGPSVLLVGVPRSLAGPHRASNDFWRRNSRGSEPMTVAEIREAFVEADRWLTEAEAFHALRGKIGLGGVGETVSPEFARPLHTAPQHADYPGALILHLVPLGRLHDVWRPRALAAEPWAFPQRYTSATWQSRETLDGRLWICLLYTSDLSLIHI